MSQQEHVFGLIGYPLSHSFSKSYFTEKFEWMKRTDHRYELFPLASIAEFPTLLKQQVDLKGINVTIPYKQAVLPFLDELDSEAASIGAVNVIQIKNGQLKGYNSDIYGFELSLRGLLAKSNTAAHSLKALVLGTGGASLAICYVLKKLNIDFSLVSRSPSAHQLSYEQLSPELLKAHRLVVNCTPVGTFPKQDNFPALPYEAITKNHFFYDLVYNPKETLFLQKAKQKGAIVSNGLIMLHLQAEKAWEIWNKT